MKKKVSKNIVLFALVFCAGLVRADLPQPAWTWDGTNGAQVGTLPSGEKVYTVSGKLIDTSSDGINITVPANYFTFSFWSKYSGTNWRNYAGFSDADGGFMIQQNSNRGQVNIYHAKGTDLGDQHFMLSADELQLVTFVSTNGTLLVYVNGVEAKSYAPGDKWSTFAGSGNMLYFGLGTAPSVTGGSAGNGGTRTHIADARIYTQALTAEEVKALYEDYDTRANARPTYTATVSADGVVWDAEPPATLADDAIVRYVGSGSVTLDRDITAQLEIGNGVTLTPPTDGITGFISIGEGGVLNLASGTWLSQTNVFNRGTIRITGGTMETPVVINDNGAADTGVGAVTIADGAVLKNIAANGNKVYKVTGAGAGSTFIMTSDVNWGMTDGTEIRNCRVIVQNRNFFLERKTAFNETVDLVLNNPRLNVGYPHFSFTVGSISGSAVIDAYQGPVTLSVNMDRAATEYAGTCSASLDVSGEYPLTLKGASISGSVIVGDGSTVVFDPGADSTQTVWAVSTTNDTGSIRISSGTVALGTSRPRFSGLSGVAKLVMTAAEQGEGLISLPWAQDQVPGTESFEVLKGDGETSAVWITTDPVALVDGILQLRFTSVGTITADESLSESVNDYSEGDLTVNGGEDGVVLTFDRSLPDAVTLILSGKVTLKTSGSVAALPARVTVEEGAEVTIEAPFDGDFSLPANTTFILQGGADSERQTAFGRFTVPANAMLKTKGHLAVTLASNNGTFDVLDGVATVTAGGTQTVKGTLYVRKGAEFVNVTNDAVVYGNNIGGTIIHVYGVLNMKTSRWTVGGTCELHLYAGCEVKGTGDGDGIIDFFRGGEFVQVHPNPDDEDATTAVFSGLVRVRNNEAKVKIESGVYVNFNGGLGFAPAEGRKLTRTGAGGFIGTNYLKGVELDLGTHSGVKGRFVSASGENKLIIQGSNANSFCGDDSKDDPVIKVESGSTLTLAIQDYSGWNGDVTEHGWIVNNGTLKLAAKGSGSRFFREHLVIGDGATTIIEQNTSDSTTERAQILYGGAPSEELAQIQLPAGTATVSTNGTAAAKVLYLGNDGTGGYGGKGAGVSVGKGAVLTLEPTIKGPDGITKWGDGELKFTGPMDEYRGTLTLKGGKISIAPGCGFTGNVVTDLDKMAVTPKTLSDGTVVYRLTWKYFYLIVR